jgi:hypothetical protein
VRPGSLHQEVFIFLYGYGIGAFLQFFFSNCQRSKRKLANFAKEMGWGEICAILYWYRLTLKLLMQLKQTKTINNLQLFICSSTRLLILLTEQIPKFVEFRRQQQPETPISQKREL